MLKKLTEEPTVTYHRKVADDMVSRRTYNQIYEKANFAPDSGEP